MQLNSADYHLFSLLDDEEWGTQFSEDGFMDLGPLQRRSLFVMSH